MKEFNFGGGVTKSNEEISRWALEAAVDFIEKAGGRKQTKSITYDFRSPFDELNLRCVFEEGDGWCTECSIYDKEHGDLNAVCTAYGTDDPQNIADTIVCLLQELYVDTEGR